jgi:SAM-dependent methyltransferase
MPPACRICGADTTKAKTYIAAEMMFGSKEPFEYFQCTDCECLQIADIPADLSRYYPDGYYSGRVKSPLEIWVRGRRIRHEIGKSSLLGAYVSRAYGADSCTRALSLGNIQRDDAILDVGSGSGFHLRPLHAAGFRNLIGIDPFAKQEFAQKGLQIRRAHLQDVEGQYRLIMMHHSFEHMPNAHEVLAAAAYRLTSDGLLLIRIPVLGYGWHRYGVNWAELDAPRHIHLHTRQGFERLARRHGFDIMDVTFDSTELEIWASEQYIRGIAHTSKRSYAVDRKASVFTAKEISSFKRTIDEQNRAQASGRAAFILRKDPIMDSKSHAEKSLHKT